VLFRGIADLLLDGHRGKPGRTPGARAAYLNWGLGQVMAASG
jgi:hypothetical protein